MTTATIDPDTLADFTDRIRNAYRRLAREPGDPVALVDLRDLVGGDRSHVDAALVHMDRQRTVCLTPQANRKLLRPADRTAAVRLGGEDQHLISIQTGATP